MATTVETRRPTMGERLVAGAAHIATMLSLAGIAFTALLWLTQRRRSPYVAAQAREAVIWQITAHLVVSALIAILAIVALVALGGAASTNGNTGALAGGALLGSLIGIYLIPLAAAAYFLVMSLVGAIAALGGRPYHYPLTGRGRPASR